MVERKCDRCGINRDLPAKKQKKPELCKGCRIKIEHAVRYDNEVCLAWRGDFDSNDNPMHNGKLFLPGQRSCGHRDCINIEHINQERQ